MSAAPSPTSSISRPITRPANRDRHRQVGHHAAEFRGGRAQRPGEGRRRSEIGRFPRPRHDRGHQRADRAQGRQGRADHDRRLSRHAGDRARQPARLLQPALREAEALRAALPAPRGAGRISYRGAELKPLDLSGLPAILDDFRKEGVEAVAVCFLHSYANTSHEQAALAEVQRLWPDVSVVVLAPDHPRVARIRALQHRRAVGLCPADRRALSVAAAQRPEGAGLRQEPLHHAVELRRRFAGIGARRSRSPWSSPGRPRASGARPNSAS